MTTLKLGTITPLALKVGTLAVPKAYLGGIEVWTVGERMLSDAAPTQSNTGNYTVGNKFTVNKTGTITALRYYHKSGCGGFTHKLSLWTEAGVKVATVNDASATGVNGYQEVLLTTPYTVLPGQQFRVTYLVNGPFGYSTVASSLAPSLTLVYGYNISGAAEAFPTTAVPTFQYHADVVYQQGASVFVPNPPTGGTPGTQTNTPKVLGTVFRASTPAQMTRVHFYKEPTATGVHIATVWRVSDQVKLGQVTFTGETASGWQSASLPSAIPMLAGSDYVVTISHASGGYGYRWPVSDVVVGAMTLSKTARYGSTSNPDVFPGNVQDTYYYMVDITWKDA